MGSEHSGCLYFTLSGLCLQAMKLGNGVHGAGAVEGDDGGDILDVLGLEAHADAGHARRLHLEHAGGPALGEHLEHRRVVRPGCLPERSSGRLLATRLHRVVQDGQVAQAQEVHLQEAQLLQGGHDVLGDHRTRRSSPGAHSRTTGFRVMTTPGGVGGGVAGHALDGLWPCR